MLQSDCTTSCNPQAVPRGAGRWLAVAAALGQDSSLGVDVATKLTGPKRFALRQAKPSSTDLQPGGVEVEEDKEREAWRRSGLLRGQEGQARNGVVVVVVVLSSSQRLLSVVVGGIRPYQYRHTYLPR